MSNPSTNNEEIELDFLKSIAIQIRKRREEFGITQYELATKAKVADNLIGQIERSETNTSLLTLYKICRVLELEINLSHFSDSLKPDSP